MKVAATVLFSALTCFCVVTGSMAQQTACVVADPTGTPLNIRDAPESPRIIGTLRNGTVITVERTENYRGRWWAEIKNLGWVYGNYLNCATVTMGGGRDGPIRIDPMFRTGESSAVSETKWLECAVIEEAPQQAPDTFKISIEITTGEGGNGRFANFVTDMGVVHLGRSGTYNRADQYVNTYLLSDSDNSYLWSGSPRGNLSRVMEGRLKVVAPNKVGGRWLYTEELLERNNRSVVYYKMSSECNVTWKQEYGDYDAQGNGIIRPVVPSK
jgi:hypothetical protein